MKQAEQFSLGPHRNPSRMVPSAATSAPAVRRSPPNSSSHVVRDSPPSPRHQWSRCRRSPTPPSFFPTPPRAHQEAQQRSTGPGQCCGEPPSTDRAPPSSAPPLPWTPPIAGSVWPPPSTVPYVNPGPHGDTTTTTHAQLAPRRL
jgi:hypothetical protein